MDIVMRKREQDEANKFVCVSFLFFFFTEKQSRRYESNIYICKTEKSIKIKVYTHFIWGKCDERVDGQNYENYNKRLQMLVTIVAYKI